MPGKAARYYKILQDTKSSKILQDTNGKITEATSVPGPVLACMGEVIAKGALYYGAVSPKRTLVSSER
jgi:hypothetical protein